MDTFNRAVLIIAALLLVAVPVLLLLVAFAVVPANIINQYTGYQSAVSALGGISLSGASTAARAIIAAVGVVVAVVALVLLLRELTFGKEVSRSAVIEDKPGSETRLTYAAVRALSEGAAREAGAVSPSVSMTGTGEYLVDCRMQAPPEDNYGDLADRTRDNIRRVLDEQSVPVKGVEVTVQGTAS